MLIDIHVILTFFITVLGLDYIGVENQTHVAIPKYNNKVQNLDMFDTETKALLSVDSVRVRRAGNFS